MSATQKLEKATLLFKDGKIIEVGTAVTVPKNATIIDGTGKTIYPSFIDIFSEFGIDKPQPKTGGRGRSNEYDIEAEGYYWNEHVKPQYNAYENLKYDTKSAGSLREIGFGTVVSHHNDGVVAGTGLLWTLNDTDSNAKRILKYKSFPTPKLR
ncbi:MAG: hypothetical protein HC854_16650 [Flavobacterium sp.]|nr:hypothetical protein [Flavobacterium sp.]